jgi:hypothetical protein
MARASSTVRSDEREIVRLNVVHAQAQSLTDAYVAMAAAIQAATLRSILCLFMPA